jgi:hypothetical protein
MLRFRLAIGVTVGVLLGGFAPTTAQVSREEFEALKSEVGSSNATPT